MNGICEIRVGNQTYPLRFGMVSVEELSNRMVMSFTQSTTKMMIDLIYAGMLNHAVASSLPAKNYAEVYLICEDFTEEEDYQTQTEMVWNCFQESKHGAKWKTAIESMGKKKEENENPS